MTNIPNRDEILARCRYQYDQIKLRAEFFIAQANTGVASLGDLSKWNPETGQYDTPLSDLEKKERALDTANRHIHALEVMGESICALIADDLNQWQENSKRSLY